MTYQNLLGLPSFKSEAAIKSLGRPGDEATSVHLCHSEAIHQSPPPHSQHHTMPYTRPEAINLQDLPIMLFGNATAFTLLCSKDVWMYSPQLRIFIIPVNNNCLGSSLLHVLVRTTGSPSFSTTILSLTL